MPTAMKVKTLDRTDADSLIGIQLNDRQMKLYKSRKEGNGMKERNHSLAPPPPTKKPLYSWQKTSMSSSMNDTHTYLGLEPTQTAETVPNTFSEDSASQTSYSSHVSSNSRVRKNAANAFYGQRLDPSERKRYDDQGNTWRDSQSETSSASAAASSVSAALSAASKNSRSSKSSKGSMARLRQLQQKRNGGSKALSSAGSTYGSSRSAVSVGSKSSKSIASVRSRNAPSVASSAKASAASLSSTSSSSRYAAMSHRKDPVPFDQEDEIMNETAASAVGSSTSGLSRGNRSALSVNTNSDDNLRDKLQQKPSGLSSQKEKNKFLRNTMMQWAKPFSSSSSSVVSAGSSALKSSMSSTSKSSKSSRRLSFAPKKSVITTSTDYRSPRSMASGTISPKEMAIMRKVADRNQSSSKKKFSPRRSAGKMIKSTSSRMKKLLSSSSSSASVTSDIEPVPSKKKFYDDCGRSVTESAVSIGSRNFGEIDRRKPIVMEEDLDDADGDESTIFKNQQMRKKSKRGRSSIFKKRIGHIGMGVMDDLIDSNDELSSDEDDEEYASDEEHDYDVSIHQARSVKSAMTPHRPTTTPRDINSIVGENQDFLHEMRKGPLKQALATPSLRQNFSAPVPTMSESYDNDTEEFRVFTNALKAELSGTHSKLYDSFQIMFRGDEHNNNEPIKPLSVYPGSLDLKTKDSISKMSKYLNTEHDVECLISSQIVKDADVRNYVFSHEMDHRTIKQTASVDSINGGADGSQFEVSIAQHTRSVISATNDSRFVSASKVRSTSAFQLPPSTTGAGSATKFNQIKLKSRTVNDKTKTENDAVPSSWTKVRLKPVNKAKTNGRPTISTDSSETAEFHRIVLRKTPTGTSAKKNFDMTLKTAPSSLSEASGTENKPIDLESGGVNKPIKLMTPTPMTGASNKPIELSPVSGTNLKPIELNDSRNGGEDNPIKLAPSTGYDSTNPIQLAPSKGDESANPIMLAPSIDLDLNEGSVIVPLEKETEAGSDVDIKVIVGRDGITKIQTNPGQESNKANVIWRIERKDVKSALLDMSTFSVKVIAVSDKNNKDLQFPTSAQCMKFANALHEMKNNSLGSSNESRCSTGNDDATSVYVEQLSHEEQKILDEFRQRKKNGGKDATKNFLSEKLLAMHNGQSGTSKPMSVINGEEPVSPISEVSAATSALDQAKIEKKYQLMLKMKVPKEAVRGKMEQDGVEPAIIAKILGEGGPQSDAPSSTGSGLSPEDEKKASVYRRMLKMMVPPEAVAHKMKKDGIDQKIVSAVLGSGSSGETGDKALPAAAPSLTIPEQAAAQKYQKMIKMNVPKEAVEHKMKKDGIDAKIIAFVLGQSSANVSTSTSGPSKKKKAAPSGLSSAEESIASTYRKMVKMNIPKDAVQQKMMMDGVSEKIMSSVLGKSKKNTGTNNTKKGGFGAGFHWNAIDDDVSIVGSVWSKAKTSSEVGVSDTALDIAISKHVEAFQKKPENSVQTRKNTKKAGQANREMAHLITGNRKQNVAITLKAFNDYTFKELAQTIEFLDPCGKIKGDRALFLKDLLPTPAEVKVIQSYTGSADRLDTTEKWFREIVHVKRIEEKVQVMRTIETFKMDAILLGKSFQLLTDVCNQVMSSDRLPDLLDMVRQIGNRMNQGRGDDAAGFKLDFLPRLAQTKGSDKKTTALDLVVLIFCTRNQREALMLSDDYPEIQAASRMQFADLTADVRSIEASFRKCKTEFEKLQKEHGSSASNFGGNIQSDSRSETGLAKPSIRKFSGNDINTDIGNRRPPPISTDASSLMDAIKSRNGMVNTSKSPTVAQVLNAINKSNEEVRKGLSPRAALLASLEAKSQGKVEFSLEASIRRLEKFVGEANYVILPKLQAQREEAIEACKNLAAFFCEAPSERAASNLLKILAGFATGIEQSVKKYDEKQKILARKEAAMKKKNNKGAAKKSKLNLNPFKSKKTTTEQAPSEASKAESDGSGEKKSLVLMVNEMLKVAGDKEIEDYVSGKTTAVAGSKLEEIYKEEAARKNTEREDILAAIRRRRSVSTNLVPQQALSDLSATLAQEALDDKKFEQKRKQRVSNRWSSRRDDSVDSVPPKLAESSKDRRKSRTANRWSSKPTQSSSSIMSTPLKDIDEESIGAFEAMIDKRKQNAFNRWANKH